MADYHTYAPITRRAPYHAPRPASRSICLECLSRVCKHLDVPPFHHLTFRQAEVVRLLGGGLTNKEIGLAAGLSEGSVKCYLSAFIFPAIGLTSRLEVAIWAREHAELLAVPNQLPPIEAPAPSPVADAFLAKYPVSA